ncbi:hypothetical protein ACWCOP_04545 [Maricaulaceae bacterium MS644]
MGGDGGEDQAAKRGERSELLEETLGFNFRSLKTLADLWVRPRAVMAAITARDRVTYTPMVRLFLALIGLQIAISVLWGGYGGLMADGLEAMPEDQRAAMIESIGRPLDEFLSIFGNVASVLHPPLVSGVTALSVLVLGAFGEKRSFAVNLNLVFAVLTAGSLVGLGLLFSMVFVEANPALNLVLIGGAYCLTWFRGLPSEVARTGTGRIVKSIVLALTMLTLVLIGGVILQVIAVAAAVAWP